MIIIGSMEEIFFDDSDMSTEEIMWNSLLWYGEALNPFSFVKGGKFTTKRGLTQTFVGGGMFTTAAIIASSLNTIPGQGYTFQRGLAFRADSYRAAVQFVGKTGSGLLTPFFGYAAGILATAVTGAWAYEMYVNNPLRRLYNADVHWYGPYASGFGTVV